MSFNQTATNTTTSILGNLMEFSTQIVTDPVNTLLKSPVFVITTLLILTAPFLLKKLFPELKKVNVNPLFTLLDEDYYKEKAESLKVEELVWTIGTSERSCSVSENGVLRAIEFTADLKKPTPEHIFLTVLKAICEPVDKQDDSMVRKPLYVVYLDTADVTEAQKCIVEQKLNKYDIKTSTINSIRIANPELLEQKGEEQPEIPAAAPQAIPFNEQPKRGCFNCRKEIEGKASQCSACKAVIYCSVDCAKKNWGTHKQACPEFKQTIIHAQDWEMHKFPFDYYKKDKPLCNYNVVPFLGSKDKHNVGIFQRLCGCFQEVQWGVLGAQALAKYQQVRPTAEEVFASLGLDQEMFPLSKPFEEGFDVSSIDSWESYYNARGYSMSNPAALVLEVPLTIFHMINQFHLKNAPAVPEGERRKITIHLVGVEKEADLIQLYECLLPLFPNTDLAIHMIGDKIAKDIPPQQRACLLRSPANNSTLFMTLSTSFYHPQHLDGTAFEIPEGLPHAALEGQNFGNGVPDLIICLNAGLVIQQEWAQAVAAVAKSGVKLLITERMEQLCNAAKGNLPRLGCAVGLDTQPNPFRQPLYDFKKDVNLPGWSNGFIFGIGNFE